MDPPYSGAMPRSRSKGERIPARRRLFGLHGGDVRALLSESDRQLRAATDRVAQLEGQAVQAARKTAQLAAESSRTQARAEAAERKLAAAGTELADVRRAVSTKERDLDSLQRRCSEQQEELERLRIEVDGIGRAALQTESIQELTF